MSSHSISLMLRHAFKGPREVCELSPEKPALVPPDEELMELVQKKDHEAFGQIFDRYYIAARSIARKMLRNPEDAADVVQESFLDVYQNAGSFVPSRGTLKAWISCLTYHRSLKRLMLLKKRDRESGDLEAVAYSLQADLKPEQLSRSFDFRRCLDSALGILHEKQRQTMYLYFFEGQELSAVAAILGETLGNTRHHLYRGMAKLREELVQKDLLQGYIEFIAVRNQAERKLPGGK
jgi:RNA polymerase sigma-70 factor (ECF subfamily)